VVQKQKHNKSNKLQDQVPFLKIMAAATVELYKTVQGGPRRHSEKYWGLLTQRIGKVAKENK